MCVVVFAWQVHADHPLIFAGNRDELHARPAVPAGFWEDAPQVLAGRDLQAGGTWAGASLEGRFAVVTNYREGVAPPKAPRSRGELTAGFLRGSAAPEAYIQEVARHAADYGGFGLLVGDRQALWFFCNRDPAGARAVEPGLHGLSNHLLDTPWPKVRRCKAQLAALLSDGMASGEALFRLLADRTPAPEAELPDTGIGRERERLLSAAFVRHPEYGTRCATLIRLDHDGGLRFAERRFDPAGWALETRCFHLAGAA